MRVSGHFAQILGDEAENAFFVLARGLGYTIIRSRNPFPGIDFVADFHEPVTENCYLKRPLFSPQGMTAFSVKRGGFTNSDVNSLVDYVHDAKDSRNHTLATIKGGVLVSGSLLTEGKLNLLRTRKVFCWDVRRLIFYAIKARVVAELLRFGPIKEQRLGALEGSFLLAPIEYKGSTMIVKAHCFIDDHNLVFQYDHAISVLEDITKNGLKPIAQVMLYEVHVRLTLHSVGPVQRTLVEQAYDKYSGGKALDDKIFFSLDPGIEIQSYAGAPWAALLKT